MIVTGMDASWLQLYIFFWSAHFAALLLTTVLLLYHINLVIQGKLCDFVNHTVNLFFIILTKNELKYSLRSTLF